MFTVCTVPPLKCGALMLPCLALPRPFCGQGFLPPPLISLRPFTLAVPYNNNKINNTFPLSALQLFCSPNFQETKIDKYMALT